MDNKSDPKLTLDAFVLNIRTHRDVVELRSRLAKHEYQDVYTGIDRRNKRFTILQRICEPYTLQDGRVRTKKNCGWIGVTNEDYRDEVDAIIQQFKDNTVEL